MAIDEPTWDDSGFDEPSTPSGFLSSDASGRRRIQPDVTATPEIPRTAPRRSLLAWVGILALLVLVIGIGGSVLYWLTRPSAMDVAFKAPAGEEIPATEPEQVHEDLGGVDSAVVDSAATVTTTQTEHDAVALAALYGDRQASASASTSAASSAQTSTETAASVSKPKTSKDAQGSPALDVSKRKSPAPAPPSSSKLSETPVVKSAKPATAQTASKQEAQFVVQVFSSPSRADADEWLQRLRSQSVQDPYVTEQQIKGETWYRVRFGSFSSRTAAETEALRLGFRQPWIARIR